MASFVRRGSRINFHFLFLRAGIEKYRAGRCAAGSEKIAFLPMNFKQKKEEKKVCPPKLGPLVLLEPEEDSLLLVG